MFEHIAPSHDPSFSLAAEIQRQVDFEDILAWARMPHVPDLGSVPHPSLFEMTPAVETMFAAQMFKKTLSILTP